MEYQFIPYIIPLSISFVILMILAVYGYKHRTIRGAKPFVVSMVIGALWAAGNALEMAGTDLSTKLFWANIQYIAYGFAPVAWLVMVLQFTDREDWVNKKNIILMSIIPVITIILVWTDHIHGLVRYNLALDTSGGFSVITKDYGHWFWVHFSYCYLLNFLTVFFLFRVFLLKNNTYRKQAFYLLIGFLIVGLSNIFYVAGLPPFKSFDISPVLFSVSGIIIGWGIFHFRLFDLVPIARGTVIEKMGSGIIVIDEKERIIDINPQAKKMLRLTDKVDIGQSLQKIAPDLQELITVEEQDDLIQTEFALTDNEDKTHYYEVYVSMIRDYRDKQIVWVIIINDITDLKEAREKINLQQQELAIMDERERMARDLHDNLGQILNFSNIQIQAVQQELKKNNRQLAEQYLQRLNDIVKDAHKDIREYVYNIRNNSYYKNDLIDLFEKEIEEFKENSHLEIEFEISKDFSLETMGTEEKLQLVHILREAFTNSLKYAEADKIRVFLDKKEELIELVIADDGKGINSSIDRGSGLNIMNERAKLIGGQLKIDSKPDKGTEIIVNFSV